MTVNNFLNAISREPTLLENIAAKQTIPSRSADFQPIPTYIHSEILRALKIQGIVQLFSHQLRALEELHDGKNIIIVTGTASGKSLCYNLPIINNLLENPDSRSLLIFPTEALSQDQFHSVSKFLISVSEGEPRQYPAITHEEEKRFSVAVYDGDTPSPHRKQIRKTARLIFTNPDMLHMGILPHHTSWVDFFRNLRYVVIDEVHIYRGVFGSHLANVLRRLNRVLSFYQTHPQFILTSATIANPGEFAEKLVEKKFIVIDKDGSHRGPQEFMLYNPPLINPNLGLRKSTLLESVRLADVLFTYNLQTIIFCRSRPSVELLLSYLLSSYPDANSENKKIRGYRSGYLPVDRRIIENDLRSGKLKTVIATNALELGIDIGGVDATIMVGYPGTIASTRQQSGRAGRGLLPSLAILMLTSDPIDQFLAHHPNYLFDKNPEAALINPDNILILLDHFRCALFELPFDTKGEFGNLDQQTIIELLDVLVERGEAYFSKGRCFYLSDKYPAQSVSLRNSSSDQVSLQVINASDTSQTQTIGQVDYPSSFWMVHPGAVYLHEAQTFIVKELDFEKKVCLLNQVNVDYFTKPRRDTKIQILEIETQSEESVFIKGYGEILVTTQVVGFRKIRWFTNEQVSIEELDLPPSELQTTGFWISLIDRCVEELRQNGVWNNDPNIYGPNWEHQKNSARVRDNFTCQVCGIPEGKRKHDVHHITPFKMFDSFMKANELENLTTLCPRCHQQVESNVRIRSGMAGLAYLFGQLAPLFLMCDVKDIGVHSDPKADFLDYLPSVVIYEEFTGGLGFSSYLYDILDELVENAHALIQACQCKDGCPSCVGPGGENGSGSKLETLAILDLMRKNAFHQ